MPNLEQSLAQCGVTQNNIFENIFTYSIFASQNLDFLASAAGRVDIEAARFLRMAQQMMRTRVDVLFRMVFFGQQGFGARFSFQPFREITIATSEDAGQAFKAEANSIVNDLNDFLEGATDWGENMRMEGPLFENLRLILKTEEAFNECDLKAIVTTPDNEHAYIMEKLQMASITIQANLYRGLELLRNKILIQNGNRGKLICTSCGSQLVAFEFDDNGAPAPCPVCGSPPSTIVEYKLKILPMMDEIYKSINYK